MNDSGFELSSIRQLIIKVTGISILSIKNCDENVLNQEQDRLFLIHFTSANYQEKVFQMTITYSALNKLCESDLTVFKDYFEKFAAIQVK